MKLAVLGTGTMGQGIAQLAAQCGLDTRVYDVASQRAKHAVDAIAAQLDSSSRRASSTRRAEGSARRDCRWRAT